MTIRAVLFDIDGTLVDSNDFHVQAWSEAFATVGAHRDAQAIHDQIGKGSDLLVPALMPGIGKDELEKLADAHAHAFKSRFLERVVAFPQARALLARVHEAGQRIVLASSASKEELDHYIGLLDARELVSATVSIDDVKNSKPAPDIFAVALEKVALSGDEVLAIGDTPYDAEAAGKCGIAAIGVRSGKFPDAALAGAGTIAVYDDVAALLADYDASPLVLGR